MSPRRNRELKTLESLAKIFKDLATLTYSLLYQNFNSKPRCTQYRTPKKTKKVWKATGRIIPVVQQRGNSKKDTPSTSQRMSLDKEEDSEEEYFDARSHDEDIEMFEEEAEKHDPPPDKPVIWNTKEAQEIADYNNFVRQIIEATPRSKLPEVLKTLPPHPKTIEKNQPIKPKRTNEDVAPSKEEEDTDQEEKAKKKIQRKGFDYGAIFRSTPTTTKKPKTPDK